MFSKIISALVVVSLVLCNGHIAIAKDRDPTTPQSVRTCAVDGSSNAYRHNPLIVTTLDKMRNDLKITASGMYKAYVGSEEMALAQQRLNELPSFSNDDSYTYSVAYAPIFMDPYHLCTNERLRFQQGEYALLRNDPSLRIKGDACADDPELVFDDPRRAEEPLGWLDRSRFPQAINRGYGFGGTRYLPQFYLRSGNSFADGLSSANLSGAMAKLNTVERGILYFLAIAERQCGSIPDVVHIEGRQIEQAPTIASGDDATARPQRRSMHSPDKPRVTRTIYRGKFYPGRGGFALEHADQEQALLFTELEAYLRNQQAQRQAREQARAEQFAIGAAMVGLALALSAGAGGDSHFILVPSSRSQDRNRYRRR